MKADKESQVILIGDRVKVVKIEYNDSRIGLSIGETGTVESIFNENDESEDDVFNVRLDRDISSFESVDKNNDGTYQMLRRQLEVIEAGESNA